MVDPFGFVICFRDSTAKLGEHTTVYQFATIEGDVTTGRYCVIGSNAWVGRGTVMGDHVRVQHGTFICRNTKIGDRVFLGPNVTLTDDKYPHCNNHGYDAQPPVLDDDCSIGAGAVICPGVRIGKNATVGAGAVVTHDVADGQTVVGVPAYPFRETVVVNLAMRSV